MKLNRRWHMNDSSTASRQQCECLLATKHTTPAAAFFSRGLCRRAKTHEATKRELDKNKQVAIPTPSSPCIVFGYVRRYVST